MWLFPRYQGTPCEFDCEICGVDDDMKTATPSNAKAVTVAGVQAMIDALPDVEDVRKGNAEKVKASWMPLTMQSGASDEEIDELDLSRYMEVAAALEQLLYGVATQSNAVMLADYDRPCHPAWYRRDQWTDRRRGRRPGSYYVPNSYIYFGINSENSSTPIKWRVLDANTANAGTTSGMFLLSGSICWRLTYNLTVTIARVMPTRQRRTDLVQQLCRQYKQFFHGRAGRYVWCCKDRQWRKWFVFYSLGRK